MIEKITVSRDEVLHYPWLDHTWVYVYFTENDITKNPVFAKMLEMFLRRGLSAAEGKKFEALMIERNYVFIKYDTDKIIDILKNACSWLSKQNWTVKDPTTPVGAFFIKNKDVLAAFWEETEKIITEKKYHYFYQSMDGMN